MSGRNVLHELRVCEELLEAIPATKVTQRCHVGAQRFLGRKHGQAHSTVMGRRGNWWWRLDWCMRDWLHPR